MSQVSNNVFDKGLQQDISKHRVPNGYMVDAYQIEITNKEGSNFAATSANGNKWSFDLPAGYVPMATKEYNGLLYICSLNTSGYIEVGTYKSPVGAPTEGGIAADDTYKAFDNIDDNNGCNITYAQLDIEASDHPTFIDMVLQHDYDDTVNVLLFSKSFQPLLINSNFKYENGFFYSTERVQYQANDLSDQIKLILDATDTLQVDYESVDSGGQLKAGSYVYYFSYLTQDFNETEIAGQSSLCEVFFGNGDKIRGGDEGEITSQKVELALTNVDTTFKYLQVYATYRSGAEDRVKQTLKFAQPIIITDRTMIFSHSGIESVDEIPVEDLGIDFANIKSASCADTAKGYLFLGDITERDRLDQDLANFAQTIELTQSTRDTPLDSEPYRDPENTYKYLGYFGGESYAFGLVAKYKGGGYSQVFPVRAYDYVINQFNELGCLRFQKSTETELVVGASTSRSLRIKHVQAKFNQAMSTELRDIVSEVFIVRAERQNSGLIGQGIMMPTLMVPPGEFLDADNVTYWSEHAEDADYKFVPALDGILEAYLSDKTSGGNDTNVVNADNIRVNGWLPVSVNPVSDGISVYKKDKWAFYSPALMANTPDIAARVGAATRIEAIATIRAEVDDELKPIQTNHHNLQNYNDPLDASNFQFGTKYEFFDYVAPDASEKNINEIDVIPEGTYASGGGNFISKLHTQINMGKNTNNLVRYKFNMSWLPYIGIALEGTFGGDSINDPQGIGARVQNAGLLNTADKGEASFYSNLGKKSNFGYLANIYRGTALDRAEEYYPNVDSIPFAQIGKRWKPGDLPTGGGSNTIDLFDGDCYITKVYQRMYHSGFRDPLEPDQAQKNQDMGLIFSFWAESTHNTNLRHRYYENSSDLDRLTFYPFSTNYREQRYKDSSVVSPGYSYEQTDFIQLPNPIFLPDNKSSFYSRVFPSSLHVPNSFVNGHRVFTIGAVDYPTNFGRLIRIMGYGNNLMLIFQHGVGLTPVENRTPTGQDVAGSIFIKTEGTITNAFGPMSTRYGSQHPLAVYKSPHYIYGMDAQEGKLWRAGPKGFDIISDGYIGSKILTMDNPRIGYDPKNRLVYFTTNDWAYIYSEDLGIFVTTTIATSQFYSELAKDGMFGWLERSAYKYEPGDELFDEKFEPYIEFAINENFNITKVFDYVNILSNNVSPKTIHLKALNFDGTTNQECTINRGTNFFTEEDTIFFRDKKWVAQIPKVDSATYKVLEGWAINNRLRDKYIIVRVTYDSIDFETTSIQTFYRMSKS
jgi:hypothetical protein